jgi:tRNA-specific 2-thiouridylase
MGPLSALLVTEIAVREPAWVDVPPAAGETLEAQMSAHGSPVPATWSDEGGEGVVTVAVPIRRVAPGQSVVLYRGDAVVGGGLAVGR